MDVGLVDVSVDPPVARALYFAAAECLTNVVLTPPSTLPTEAGTRETDVELIVSDDGCGGARIAPGGGLAGIAARLESLGGGQCCVPEGKAGR